MKTIKKTPVRGEFAASSAGFSLIELAIGMALVGIILGGALLIGGKLWDSDRRETNLEHLQAIKTALLDFARKNGRLPMMDTAVNHLDPAIHDGEENKIPNDDNYPLAGSGPFGWVPYKNIDTVEKDSFGKPVQYFVNWQLAKENKNRPCQALKNMLLGKITTVSPNIYFYYKQVGHWDNPPPIPPLTTWYPVLKIKNANPIPVAAVLVNSGPDKTFNEYNVDAYTITSKWFVAKESSATFDDVVVYVTLSEAYEALNCQ